MKLFTAISSATASRDLSEALRELEEEVQIKGNGGELRLIGSCLNLTRDQRIVPFSKIEKALIYPAVPKGYWPPTKMVKAAFGCPDYIFCLGYGRSLPPVDRTDELQEIAFRSIWELDASLFGAGHGTLFTLYREMVISEAENFEPSLVTEFC